MLYFENALVTVVSGLCLMGTKEEMASSVNWPLNQCQSNLSNVSVCWN